MGISTHLDSNDIAYHMLYHSDNAERLLRRILMKKKIEGRYAVVVFDDGSFDYDITGNDSVLSAAFTGLTDTLAEMVQDGTIGKDLAFFVFDRYKGVLKALLDGTSLDGIH